MVGHNTPLLGQILFTVAESSATFFITITILTITVMSIKRWLYMSQGSFVASHRRHFTSTVIMLVLFPIPTVVISVLSYGDPWYRHLFVIIIITQMFSCYLITLFAYFKVYRIIRRHQHQIQASRGICQNFGQTAIDLAKYKKSVASMLYILLLFSICFLPFIVSTAVDLIIHRFTEHGFVTQRVLTVLVFLSSSLNPGLYLWRMRDIRNGLKQLLARRRAKSMC